MGDTHSAHHNTSLGVALPPPSRLFDPLHTGCSFHSIDTSEIFVYLLNPHLESLHNGETHGSIGGSYASDIYML
jgi:hypothetical protein